MFRERLEAILKGIFSKARVRVKCTRQEGKLERAGYREIPFSPDIRKIPAEVRDTGVGAFLERNSQFLHFSRSNGPRGVAIS